MKPTSRYTKLRAIGQGTVAGCISGVLFALLLAYLGELGLYGLFLIVGVGCWCLAELLDRRARRQRHYDPEQRS